MRREVVVDPTRVFIWLDEDGLRCSPRHRSLKAAINFIRNPNERWVRDGNGDPKLVRIDQEGFPSQKPPAKLVIGEWVIRDISPEEQAKVDQVKHLMDEGFI